MLKILTYIKYAPVSARWLCPNWLHHNAFYVSVMVWVIMCELLGMSANVPTDICFSFPLVQRGGGTGPHKDGWDYVL
ncbi:MAG: class II glutamine amidotransferase [Enterobacteriaceae bacterium]